MSKPRWRIALIAGLLALLASLLIVSRVRPAFVARQYFWLERNLDVPVELEPLLIKIGVLRPARVRVRGGFTMFLDPRDLVPRSLLQSGEWQPDVWSSLQPVLPKGAVLLDVGAHIGYFSLRASREVGPEGRAIAFEPNPETASLLRDNIAANHLGNITVEEIACTDKEQQLTLYAAPINNTGASSLSAANAAYGTGPPPRPFQVRGRPIDDVVRELNLGRVDAIKIDVEGAELQVLRGALETLKHFHPKIVLEIVPSQLANFNTTPEDVVALIKSTGYTMGAPVSAGATDWEWTMAQSTVKISDPLTARQLLRGFRGVEANTWSWTRRHFDIALRPPEGASSKGATLVAKLVIPEVVLRQVGDIRLTVKTGSVELPGATLRSAGNYEYRTPVPARLLQNNPTEISFSLDKTITSGNEELGVMVLSIGLEQE